MNKDYKKALKLEIENFLKEIDTDETLDEEFYSLEKLRDKYSVNWERWKAFNTYTYNECISLLGGIEPGEKSEINAIIWENCINYNKLWHILDRLLSKYTSGAPVEYPASPEERVILEKFFKMIKIEESCITKKSNNHYFIRAEIKKDYIIDYLHLPSFEEIEKDFDAYCPETIALKKDRFREIAAELKRKNPSRYGHIPDSFLTNENIENGRLFKSNQDFLQKLAISLKQTTNDLGEKLTPSEAVECVSFILNICIRGSNENPCYNPSGKKAPKGFSYYTVLNAMKNMFDKTESRGNSSKEAKSLRKEKINRIIPHLKGTQFYQFIEYFNGIVNQKQICRQYVAVTAFVRTSNGDEWGKRIEFENLSGEICAVDVP
ncbi:MAG: hypothetical protein LBC04_03390, partial [Holosporaceae bacterium]|nr:hypothetical protein [Holosporaceae bacterium]